MIYRFNENFNNLPALINEFDTILEDAAQNLTMKNKTLEEANREQPSWYCYYNSKYQEIKSLNKIIENMAAQKKGQLWKQYTTTSNISLKITDMEQYINSDIEYMKYKNYLIIVEEMVGMFNSLVKAFEARGYSLRNITDARVHEVQFAVLV
jgi:hypothetical protein